MNLQQLIARLENYPRDRKIKHGFHNPHSYRGYYDQLAFEPKENTTVGDMLDAARSAVNKFYEGYKGGSYLMDNYTEVWIAEYGHGDGEQIGNMLLDFILGERR